MSLKLGAADIAKVYIGSTAVERIYLGADLIWSNVDFRGIGGGAGAGSRALSWTEDIAEDDGVIVFGCILTQASISLAATVDGAAMSVLQSPVQCFTDGINRLYLYALGITNPHNGTELPIAVGLGGGANVFYHHANSIAMSNVSSFGTPITATGAAGAASISVNVPSTGRIVAAMVLRVTDLADGGVIVGESGLGVKWPRARFSGGAWVVGVSRG